MEPYFVGIICFSAGFSFCSVIHLLRENRQLSRLVAGYQQRTDILADLLKEMTKHEREDEWWKGDNDA